MSRTTRKPLQAIESNEESYIKKYLGYRARRYHFMKRQFRQRKPKEQYEAEVAIAEAQYQEKLKIASFDESGKPYIGTRLDFDYCTRKYTSVPAYIHQRHVSRYHYVSKDWSIEEEIEELRKEYNEFTRDGHWNETGRNTGFKEAAAKAVRLANRRLEKKVLSGEDYDHLPYPNEHDGDFLRWSFW